MASASSSRSATPRTGTPLPPVPSGSQTPQVTDIYRPLATAIQSSLRPFTSDAVASGSGSSSLPALLHLDAATYSARLSGKTVLLTDIPGSASAGASSSSLVTGRKKNRGDDTALRAARAAQQQREAAASQRGTVGSRKAAKLRRTVTGPTTKIDYTTLLPLHHLHVRYITQLCALPTCTAAAALPTPPPSSAVRGPPLLPGLSPEALQSKLVKADMTGARLSVRAAKNPALVGLSGIVVEETAGSFRLLGRDSVVRVLPKVGSQFTLRFPAYAPEPTDEQGEDLTEHIARTPQVELDILGASFAYRSGDRAGRKFRSAQGGGGGSGWAEGFVEADWTEVLRRVHDGEDDRGKVVPRSSAKRKRGKSRRKDPLVQGSVQVF